MFLYYAVEVDEPNAHMKKLVMRHVQPEFLDVTTLLPLLNKYLPMTHDDNYTLMDPSVSLTEKAIALMNIMLPNKGRDAYMLFAKCLQEEKEHPGHQTLAKLLHKCKWLREICYIYNNTSITQLANIYQSVLCMHDTC